MEEELFEMRQILLLTTNVSVEVTIQLLENVVQAAEANGIYDVVESEAGLHVWLGICNLIKIDLWVDPSELVTFCNELIEKTSDRLRKEGMIAKEVVVKEVAKYVWRYVLTNESMLTDVIAKDRPKVKFATLAAREDIPRKLLRVKRRPMNLGGKCWYFARVWRMMSREEKSAALCRLEIRKAAARHGPPVAEFMEWMIGADYSLSELRDIYRELYPAFLGDLITIVYNHLVSPTWERAKQEILLLI